MFYIEDLDLEIIKNKARDQLLDGSFPSFSGSPDYDDFISQVINKEAEIILGLQGITKLEDVYNYKTRASEFLTNLFEILDVSFTVALKTIQDFTENQEEPDEEIVRVGKIRRARLFWRILQAPWFEAIMKPDRYQKLLDKLRTIGKL